MDLFFLTKFVMEWISITSSSNDIKYTSLSSVNKSYTIYDTSSLKTITASTYGWMTSRITSTGTVILPEGSSSTTYTIESLMTTGIQSTTSSRSWSWEYGGSTGTTTTIATDTIRYTYYPNEAEKKYTEYTTTNFNWKNSTITTSNWLDYSTSLVKGKLITETGTEQTSIIITSTNAVKLPFFKLSTESFNTTRYTTTFPAFSMGDSILAVIPIYKALTTSNNTILITETSWKNFITANTRLNSSYSFDLPPNGFGVGVLTVSTSINYSSYNSKTVKVNDTFYSSVVPSSYAYTTEVKSVPYYQAVTSLIDYYNSNSNIEVEHLISYDVSSKTNTVYFTINGDYNNFTHRITMADVLHTVDYNFTKSTTTVSFYGSKFAYMYNAISSNINTIKAGAFVYYDVSNFKVYKLLTANSITQFIETALEQTNPINLHLDTPICFSYETFEKTTINSLYAAGNSYDYTISLKVVPYKEIQNRSYINTYILNTTYSQTDNLNYAAPFEELILTETTI